MKKTVLFIIVIMACLIMAFSIALAKEDFYGKVEKMPEGGMVGEWVVGGRTVTTTKNTEFKEKYGKLQVGAYVEVDGAQKDGKFIASEIETKVKD